MSASQNQVPAVDPQIIQTVLREARAVHDEPWKQARLVGERGLRARSDAVMQVLAEAALDGGTWADAVERAAERRGPAPSRSSHPWWAALGRMTTMHAESEIDVWRAVAFFDLAHSLDPSRPFGRPDYLAYVQALWDTGQRERIVDVPKPATTLEPGEFDFIELNLLSHRGDHDAWVARLNRAVTEPVGLAPIVLSAGARTRFDALRAEPSRAIAGDSLITVIMSAFQRGPELLTAVESILNQTWESFELIVVDDCSGDNYQSVLEQVEGMDERIQVIRQASNQGTYMARNRALSKARGEYITFQDDDDWSHPERLERQVAPMIADATVHSTLSHAVQADDGLVFRHASRRTRLMNSSSLMFRRADLVRLGGFDSVRKGADTEFIRRLRAALPGRQETLPEDLAFVRLTGGSLSRADFRPGWNHPSRSEYAEAAQWWHRAIQRGESARLDARSSSRPFPAPSRFLVEKQEGRSKFDLVLAADLASPAVVAGAGWSRVTAAVEAGLKVGVVPIDNPYRVATPGRTRITSEVRQLINERQIARVFLDEDALCRTLIFDSPVLLEMGDQTAWRVEVDEVQILCSTPPVELDTSGRWSIEDAAQALGAMLHSIPQRWWATNAEVRHALEELGVSTHHELLPNKPISYKAGPPLWRPRGKSPVIGCVGTHGEGSRSVTYAEVMAVYPSDGELDVRMLGELAPFLYRPRHLPARWLYYDSTDMKLDTFLAQLDVYVHVSANPPTLLEQRIMVRAIGLGTPVVVVGENIDTLTGAVTRCDAQSVVNVVKRLCQSPARYTEAVARARVTLEKAGLLAAGE